MLPSAGAGSVASDRAETDYDSIISNLPFLNDTTRRKHDGLLRRCIDAGVDFSSLENKGTNDFRSGDLKKLLREREKREGSAPEVRRQPERRHAADSAPSNWGLAVDDRVSVDGAPDVILALPEPQSSWWKVRLDSKKESQFCRRRDITKLQASVVATEESASTGTPAPMRDEEAAVDMVERLRLLLHPMLRRVPLAEAALLDLPRALGRGVDLVRREGRGRRRERGARAGAVLRGARLKRDRAVAVAGDG